MIRAIGGLGLGCALCCALVGCSSDDDGPDGDSGGTQAQGGTTDAGGGAGGSAAGNGGSAAGTKTGGTAGKTSGGNGGTSAGNAGSSSGGGGSSAVAGHCSPGLKLPVGDEPSGPVTFCEGYDPYQIVQPKGTPVWVYDIELDPLPVEDETTALSAQFSDGKHPSMELWTTTSLCGSGSQQMETTPAGAGVGCMERNGATPTNHLLLVLFEDAPLDQVTACATGACP